MSLEFEWDPEKAASNLSKHGVSFAEAQTVFADTLSATTYDPRPFDEVRFVTIGQSSRGKTLVVAHTQRGHTIRIISARPATRNERKYYEEGS